MKISNIYALLIFVLLSMTSCTKSYVSSFTKGAGFEEVNIKIEDDPKINAMIAPYKKQLESKMNRVIGYSAKTLPKQRKGIETLLGNFVADLMLEESEKKLGKKIDMGVVTFGGLRVAIPEGEIKVNDIFELMPFENNLVVITVDKATVQKLFDYLIKRQNTAIANTKILVEQDKIKGVFIGGDMLDKETYTIAISDYLANGGDGMSFFKNSPAEDTGLKLRDAIILHIETLHKQNKKVDPSIEGRIIIR